MVRRKLGVALVAGLVAAAAFAAPAAAHDEAPDTPMVTFVGGGWGHGIGMSQYGAYGRAAAGQTYQEILAFYYDGTTLAPVTGFAGFEGGGDIDVRVAVSDTVAVSTPLVNGAPEPGWQVTVSSGATVMGSSTRPVTVDHRAGVWSARWRDADGVEHDLCEAGCGDGPLTITRDGGSHVVLEQYEDGPNLGRYSHGSLVLHPAGHGGASRCGGAESFCVVNADMTLDEYLYGLAEVPASWPAEALKAQAVAARSYAAARARDRAGWSEPFDLYATTSDQVFTGWDRASSCNGQGWCAAVDATAGEVLVHDGAIATGFYSSSNGGYTVAPPDVWDGGTALPYLQAKPDPFDDNPANPNGFWEHTYSLADVTRWLNSYSDPDAGDQLHVGDVRSIRIDDVPPSGRVNFALVTIRGSDKTVQVLRDGAPYGYRFFNALRQGCLADDAAGHDCDALLGTKFVIVSFFDVAFDDWFYAAVQWMSAEGITTGVAANQFGPDLANTRAQLATFLWRFAGEPAPAAANVFDDVAAEQYYTDAVRWMIENEITTGTSATTFSPDDTITRAQAATLLWRFAGRPTPTVDNVFDDVAPDRYYSDAVRWMIEHRLTTGTSFTTFSPDAPLTRSQMATFLWRLAGTPEAFAPTIQLPLAMR